MNADSLEYIQPDTTMVQDTVCAPSLFDNFFSMSSKFWHGDLNVSGLGEQGVLIPYSPFNDDFLNISMFLCVALTATFWMLSKHFLAYQMYNIIHTPREGGMRLRETIHEIKYLNYFTLQWAFLAAILINEYETQYLKMQLTVPAWAMIGILSAIILVFTLVMDSLRTLPQSVYFDISQRKLYHTERTTFRAYYGILALPFTIASVYIINDIGFLAKALLFCLGIVKIIEISKVYSIFFGKNGRFLHFFLYLCTLEAVPILLMVGILTFTTLLMSQT